MDVSLSYEYTLKRYGVTDEKVYGFQALSLLWTSLGLMAAHWSFTDDG